MAQVNIPMDDGIKAEAEQLFSQLGLNFSTAVNMFVLQSIREGGIPFAVTTKTGKSDAELLAQSLREELEGKVITKTNNLLEDIQRNDLEGIGKPEPLKENLSGSGSRRIDDYHRLVYRIQGDEVIIHRCRGHYE